MKKNKDSKQPPGNVASDDSRTDDPSRRDFLGKVGVGAALSAAPFIGAAQFMNGAGSSQNATAEATTSVSAPQALQGFGPQRKAKSLTIKIAAARDNANLAQYEHPNNGDEALYANRIGNFSKTLPHHPTTGEVDPSAYNNMLSALASADFAQLESVPRTSTSTGRLANPLGGLAYNMEGPDSPALPLNFMPPPIASAGKAAEAIEVYWQALLRDVPFADYATNPFVAEACDDLSRLSDYRGPRDASGRVTPQLLFRYPFKDTDKGPIVSQFLLQDFVYDAIGVAARINARLPVIAWNPDGTFAYTSGASAGFDYLSNFSEYLSRSNGEPLAGAAFANRVDPVPHYPRSVRDLGLIAGSDRIFSVYFRALGIMGGFRLDPGNPYANSPRQSGFATFGGAHIAELVAAAAKSERHTWYHKWYVHRHLRPEAYGLLVDRHLRGAANYPLPAELLNSPVLPLIGEYNRNVNQIRGLGNETSYLLPQLLVGGSPSHPSAPAGHAITAGAAVTMLKAWFDTSAPLPSAFVPRDLSRDGSPSGPLPVYTGGDLTVLGELNKLAFNLAAGRDMSGVHWRVADNYTGLYQGEALAIRLLQEAKATYPEPNASFTITKFDGSTITI